MLYYAILSLYGQVPWFEPEGYPAWFIPGGKCGAIAPMLDLINHGEMENSDWSKLTNGLKLIATKDINIGDEILINYRNRLRTILENC